MRFHQAPPSRSGPAYGSLSTELAAAVARMIGPAMAAAASLAIAGCHHPAPQLPSRQTWEMFPRASSPPPDCPGQYRTVVEEPGGSIFLGCWGPNTRENPLSRAALAELGITPDSTSSALINETIVGSVCTSLDRVVGFCSGAVETGEILVLGVLREYEGQGIGTRLLDRVVTCLRNAGAPRLWLAAAADPAVRAHGFYRALGWRATGELTDNGDEILTLQHHSEPDNT
jgi:ribosomal protein S18 acetylase RimI-like enzyme